MDPSALLPDELETPQRAQPPVRAIPTPSAPYLQQHRAAQLLETPAEPDHEAQTEAPPLPHAFGARVLMWKQDPSLSEIGTRPAYLPGVVLAGPRDARIAPGEPGIAPVEPNAFGDFVTQPDTPQFDAVHTFAVVRQTLTMYQRALLAAGLPMPLPWQWNTSTDTSPLQVYPHGLPNVMNAFYSRAQACLKFGDFVPTGATERVYTCRSFDIVAHETAHAVLDGLKPRWLLADAPPQTGGLHEAFGDLTAIFLALSQLDQCEAVVAQTKARLHDKSFLADIAEQFGMALGSTTGLRNADNDLRLGEAGTQVHAISQVFTGAVYDVLADLFAHERDPGREDDAAVLHRVAAYLRGLLLRALIAAPGDAASYADVVNEMLRLVVEDRRPPVYANFIRNQFSRRDVVEAGGALTEDYRPGTRLAPCVCDEPGARQDRHACCGTMQLPEYHRAGQVLDGEAQALARWCAAHGRHGADRSRDGAAS
ncbi:hypothetical protein [Massilia sp. ST3]|uniref:hypothetical protein n=1 Tax=Massilia sp. ST3 TaxID=2824903 RepID=UPI001B819CAB|nr:hypothetical protein [Massilia sp. ST3]MBQ5947119.1 hypothetical protein [Massilia sp. ST3]